jgi:MFS family permease
VAIGASVGYFLGPIYSGWRAEATGNWHYPVVEIGVMGIIFSGIFYWLAEEERGGPVRVAIRPKAEKLFPTPALWCIFLFAALAFSLRDFAGSGVGSLGSLFLQNAQDMNPKTTGFVLSGMYVASVISSPVFGHLSDGGRVRWAGILIFSAMVMVAIFPHVPRNWMFAALAVYGFFFLANYPVVEAAVMESVPDAVRGRVFGLFITIGGLLGNIAHWAMGDLVKNLGQSVSQTSSYYPLYLFLAGMMLASLAGLPCLHAIRKREHLEPHAATAAPDSALQTRHSALK